MRNSKSGFVSMALVYTFLVIFLFLMLAILRTYIEKDKFLEAINSQIDEDINKDKRNRSYALSKMLEDNAPQSYDTVYLVKPAGDSLGNGNGLYYISEDSLTDENDDGKTSRIYFYRGSVENNHLIYANKCFRILRTNEDGSIRMVYDGEATDNKCKKLSQKPNVHIGTVSFSDNETLSLVEPQNGLLPVYDDSIAHSNIIDLLNEWYVTNFIETNKTEEISKNTIFCNNKKGYSTASNINYYESKKMVPVFKDNRDRDRYDPTKLTNSFSLICSQVNDRYSAVERTLSYPVGILSAEDVLLAGGYLTSSDDEYEGGPDGIENSEFYLYTGRTFWTSSAFSTNLNSSQNYMVVVNNDGYMQEKHVTETADVIPVISLAANIRINSGNGTANNPYRVD